MDTRRRHHRSVPPKGQEYAMKKDAAQRRSLPVCPPLKVCKKSTPKVMSDENSVAKAVCFSKSVELKATYHAEMKATYMEQLFSKHSKIGEGSFGVVFKVKSREDDKYYAIKQMKTSHSIQYGYAEVENYEKVGDHKNCVQFIMAWEEMKIVHIQMEYCQFSVSQYASITHKVVESQLWEILHDMLRALHYLHAKNLIHLDVKPDNIMMCDGFYKLADFGLLVDLNKHDGQKISTISDGDAKYLASEVLEGIYTYSCDIFGLGISLLELATNIELPEFGPLWHQIRKLYLPASFYDGVTRGFAVTIEKMMSTTHWQRPEATALLKYAQLKNVQRRDAKQPRHNYCQELPEQTELYSKPSSFENNNITDTPRRPLLEVRNSLSQGSELLSGSLSEKSSFVPNLKGLARIKLDF